MPSHKQVFFLAFCLLLSIPISAQTTKTSPEKWPSRPVRMIVPFAPGGLDVIARKVAIKLGEQLNISVFIDNRAGANGIIGADLVAKAQPDGYTLLAIANTFARVPAIIADAASANAPRAASSIAAASGPRSAASSVGVGSAG